MEQTEEGPEFIFYERGEDNLDNVAIYDLYTYILSIIAPDGVVTELNISYDHYKEVLKQAGWIEQPNASKLDWFHCAECQAVSFNDYLCKECRG